jgi:hypothetical protein
MTSAAMPLPWESDTAIGATMFTVTWALRVVGFPEGPVAFAKAKMVTARPGAGFGEGTVDGAV